jgi:hypothetical protein
MAVVSNVNRRAAARALVQQVATLKTIAGLTLQTHRAYESPGRNGEGLTQTRVAEAAGGAVTQPIISQLENGTRIPPDPALENILSAAGFNMANGRGGQAMLRILRVIRDNEVAIKRIMNERPA